MLSSDYLKKNRSVKKILQITENPFPPEIRVMKEAISLQEAGYITAVLCPPHDDRPEKEVYEGIQIFRPDILSNNNKLDNILMLVLFIKVSWYLSIKKIIEEFKPDVLHVHDIWLGNTARLASINKPIVVDLHENMPAAVAEYRKCVKGFKNIMYSFFQSQRRISKYEHSVLLRSSRVLTVVKEARDRVLLEHNDLLRKNIVNIENLESKRFITQQIDVRPLFEKDHFSILYIGGFGPHRGVDTLIEAMAIVKQYDCNIRVQLIGARPSDYLNTLISLVSELGVEEQTNIIDWVESDQVLANIQQADVCCVPHHSNHHTDNTVPHKLYQYMIAKKPLLVSTSEPLQRIVTQANAGFVFKSSNPLDCARVIMEMYKKHNDLEQFAMNGFAYVMEKSHNWEEKSAPTLIGMYDSLLKVDGVE